jgi:hypothetical protein
MSDSSDVTHPRSPFTLSPKASRPATPHDEMARRSYPNSAPSSVDATVVAGLSVARRATARVTPVELAVETARSVLRTQGALPPDIPSPTADLPSGQPWRRYKLARDRDRPIEFDGRVVAEAVELSFGGQVALRAAIYQTRAGQFIAEMTRRETQERVDYGATKHPYLFAKATVFDSLDVCAMSFRTHGGRLTERLLQQIGDVTSEFIE